MLKCKQTKWFGFYGNTFYPDSVETTRSGTRKLKAQADYLIPGEQSSVIHQGSCYAVQVVTIKSVFVAITIVRLVVLS